MLNCVRLSVTPWAVAHQSPLSMRFPRQEYWSGLSFLPPGDLPDPGIKPASPASPALAGEFFITAPAGKPLPYTVKCPFCVLLTVLFFYIFVFFTGDFPV